MADELLPSSKQKPWVWRFFPYFLLALVIVIIIGMFNRIQTKLPPGIEKEVAAAVDLLGKYGVSVSDLMSLIAQKMDESDYQALMERVAAMAGEKKPEVIANVVTLELTPSPIRDKINLPGNIVPWIQLEVLSEVSGMVDKKVLEQGQIVRKGDIIAVLDSRDYQHIFNSAKASYEAAAALRDRLQQLHKGQLSTRTQLDEAVAQVETLKASMDTAALNIERCTIRAPISGIINRMFIEKGQFLNSFQKVAEILQIDQVKATVGIPESDVDAVRRINEFKLTIDALGGKKFRAKKHYLSKTADAMARLYNLDLVLANPDGEILPDMFVRVEIIKQEVPYSLSVPLYSVISRNNENTVYVIKEGKAYSRKVHLGLQEGWRVQVTEGLTAGDRVIVVGHRTVNEGQTVNVVRNVLSLEEIVK